MSYSDGGYGSSSSRPLGVTIIVILGGLGSILGALGGLGLLGIGGAVGVALGLGVVVVSVANLFVLYALFQMSYWGWKWFVVLQVGGILLRLVGAATVPEVGLDPLGTLVGLVVLGYVVSIREKFERSA